MADELSEELKQNIPLSKMIQTLRDELEESMKRVADSTLKFRVDKVELELEVAVSNQGKVGGGVKFWVITAEGARRKENKLTHTFKLTLIPETAGGETPYVSDKSARRPR